MLARMASDEDACCPQLRRWCIPATYSRAGGLGGRRSEGAAHAYGLITRHGQAAVVRVPRCLDCSRRELLVRKHPTGARMKRNFAPFSHERARETQDLHEVRLVFLKGVVRSSQGLSLSLSLSLSHSLSLCLLYSTHPVLSHSLAHSLPCPAAQPASQSSPSLHSFPPGEATSAARQQQEGGGNNNKQGSYSYLPGELTALVNKQQLAPSVEQEMSAAS